MYQTEGQWSTGADFCASQFLLFFTDASINFKPDCPTYTYPGKSEFGLGPSIRCIGVNGDIIDRIPLAFPSWGIEDGPDGLDNELSRGQL